MTTLKEKAATKNLSIELHAKLSQRLCEGGFEPGEIVSIRGIAADYDIGIMPARETLKWLVAEGAFAFANSRQIIVPVHSSTRFEEILFARKHLETEIARMAFPHLSASDHDALSTLDDLIGEAIEDNDLTRYMRYNYQFHFHIYQRSQSEVLLPLVRKLWQQYGPNMRYIASKWKQDHIDDDYHQEMIKALSEGNCEHFCNALERDIEQGIGLLEEAQ